MKDSLIEIKNNSQGNNSRVEEGENQINGLEYKDAKQTNDQSNNRKNKSKRMRVV